MQTGQTVRETDGQTYRPKKRDVDGEQHTHTHTDRERKTERQMRKTERRREGARLKDIFLLLSSA
jgi:hypothetical protein